MKLTEKECQRTIVAAARMCGWRVYHNRPTEGANGRWRTALQGHAGFPDLVMVHPIGGHVWFVELKRRPNVLAPEQLAWADDLKAAGADWRIVWVPDELIDFCQLIADSSTRPGTRKPWPVTTVIYHDPGLEE